MDDWDEDIVEVVDNKPRWSATVPTSTVVVCHGLFWAF